MCPHTHTPQLLTLRIEGQNRTLTILGLGVKDISCQRWVPHFGERGYRIAPEMVVQPPSARDVNQTVLTTNGFGSLDVTPPECEFRSSASSQHWAIDLRVFGSGDNDHTWRL